MSELHAKGVNGQVRFDGASVHITREGFFGRAGHGRSSKSLSVRSIGAVQMKPANALVNGFIQFSVSGESSKRSVGFGKSQDAAKDENAVVFTKKQMPEFQAIADAVHAAHASGGAPASQSSDAASELEKFAGLHDRGVITDEEFAAKKAQILGL